MIRFEKSAVNDVVVTLYENSTVTSPIYLFKFTNQQTNVDYYFIAEDISAYITRYNRFEVEEVEDADTLNGEVTLGNEGFYNYTVYQTTLPNTSGLTTAADAVPYVLKEVENGLVWVELPTQTTITYTPPVNTTIVYNG
jgi:hypothetical protein